MTTFLTPGVYFQPLAKRPPATALVRSDIAAFIGYARQGPVALPLQLHSWRQFVAVFGLPYAAGYLGDAVKGFFENGGAACYVTRITDDSAAAAALTLTTALGYRWRFCASFLLTALASYGDSERVPDAALQLAAQQSAQAAVKRAPNPGQWGNQLSLSLDRDAVSNSWTVPGVLQQGFVSRVESITGLAGGSVVQLYQTPAGGTPLQAVVTVERVDNLRQQIYWSESLSALGFDLLAPIRLESVEFSLQLALDNRVVETFSQLAIHPRHERFIGRVLQTQSRYLSLELIPPAAASASDYAAPGYWPPSLFNQPLRGGTDGLTGIHSGHYLDALAALERVDEIGLLAAPDLVLRAQGPTQAAAPGKAAPPRCEQLEPPPKGAIFGRVVSLAEGMDAGQAAAPQPVTGVTVTYAAGGRQARTDGAGVFRFDNIDTGLVTLRFEKAGYEIEEQLTLVQAVPAAEAVEFYLSALLLPPALDDDAILSVQQAMAAQGEAGLYRIALLDPPRAEMPLAEIRGWRQKVGPAAHAALYYPWLGVVPSRDISGEILKWIPPSGHMAGIIARTELAEGVHRAPANSALRDVKRLWVAVNDAQQGLLNQEGINCIRMFAGRGLRPFGARTLSADPGWRYLNVRRLVSALEKTLEKSLQWAVFEPNNTLLRQAVTYNIGALLNRLWRQGALAGDTPQAAYRVKCDEDNNPAAVRDAGRLVAEVAIAPTVPFEFIIFRLGKTLEAIEVTE